MLTGIEKWRASISSFIPTVTAKFTKKVKYLKLINAHIVLLSFFLLNCIHIQLGQ